MMVWKNWMKGGRNQDMYKTYLGGSTIAEVAKEYGMTKQSVSYILRRLAFADLGHDKFHLRTDRYLIAAAHEAKK